ncbi:hypothetical protein H4R33_001910 [Dimargaris cristalligena]|uniref:Biogenesis of lysosome-related organelles complex 1 subunit 1 n=1 Tax=Dimargaris cristalligena TaxID=215637 RepID=A0A4P9ZX73_9FUNG|nr:hypothetical protein H4R33_001910 [Dimargaris cristalligena]RKP38276.1 biogenesis of lysosome-related organelles complex-1 subunit 1 [Dimargaris cristalligena]|eukprot:RKP38276.1 biogenesis of lysosome-related organelles complex-1 subunit 1 [Dimargaris cristalligena]
MYAGLLKEHQNKQAALRKDNERAWAEATDSVKELSSVVTDQVQLKTAQILRNQKELEKEAAELSTQVSKYTQQAGQWLKAVQRYNDALKELGDVQSWAETIERDMLDVAATLEFVHQGIEGYEDTRENIQ